MGEQKLPDKLLRSQNAKSVLNFINNKIKVKNDKNKIKAN